jgi:hypothetical protein
MARFAAATGTGDARDRAMHRLTRAMAAHPEMVAGEGRACTELMRAMEGRVAIKTGAEAVFIAIVPERKMGIALKITDGGTRAAEAAVVRAAGADRRAGRLVTRPNKQGGGVTPARPGHRLRYEDRCDGGSRRPLGSPEESSGQFHGRDGARRA